jgi:hypothetical protein
MPAAAHAATRPTAETHPRRAVGAGHHCRRHTGPCADIARRSLAGSLAMRVIRTTNAALKILHLTTVTGPDHTGKGRTRWPTGGKQF